MSAHVDDQFTELADKTIAAAEKVDCALEQFKGGLELIRDAINERIQQVTEELGDN